MIVHSIEKNENWPPMVLTIGMFDGVHQGHRLILNHLIAAAKKHNSPAAVLTFWPHPRQLLKPDQPLKLLNTLDEKKALLGQLPLDYLIIHPFDEAFSRLSSQDFIEQILVNKLNVRRLIVGYDHHFGRDRRGSYADIQHHARRLDFDVERLDPLSIEAVNVSSTKIRTALELGNLKQANQYLGYDYMLSGRVVRGQQVGRRIGFPTANIYIEDSHKLIPKQGVYAVEVATEGINYKGMMNIGFRPTIDQANTRLSIEVHLFDFDGNLYGCNLQIILKRRIRDEQRFDSIDDLRQQLEQDKAAALRC